MEIRPAGTTAPPGPHSIARPGSRVGPHAEAVQDAQAPLPAPAIRQSVLAEEQPAMPEAADMPQPVIVPPPQLQFETDENKRLILRVVSQQTGEVIRQYPSEQALELARALDNILEAAPPAGTRIDTWE